jgi:protein-S-isoprenylcysteine O-methyltransferase Ste14
MLAMLWLWFAWRFLSAFLTDYRPQDGLLLLLESFTAATFLTRRRAKTSSADPGDWVIALAGTMAPLLYYPDPLPLPFTAHVVLETGQALGTCISVFGLLVLRGSFGIVPANRGVQAAGVYRWVRHPIYAGYIVTEIAYTIANPTVRNTVIATAAIALQLIRISNEEHHLSSDPEYRKYTTRTPWRLLPFVY